MLYFKNMGGVEDTVERRTNVPALAQLAILTRSRELPVSEFLNIFVKDIAPVGFRSAESAIIEVRYAGERYSNRVENTDEEGKTRKLWRGDTQIGTLSVAFEGRDEASILPYEHDLIKSFASVLSLYLANREISEHVSDLVAEKLDESLEAQRQALIRSVAALVHDLNSPLSGLISMGSYLQRPVQGSLVLADVQEAGSLVLRAATRLERQVADVLAYARVDSKDNVLQVESLDLPGLLREVVEEIETINSDKGLYFKTNLAEAVPKYVIGDPRALKQILHNLIFNAYKYTDRGGITISVDGFEAQHESVKINFSVSDTGRGIPEKDLGKIFNPFERADNQLGVKVLGAGLGLATVKALIEKHGGTISVASQLGVGTTFSFSMGFRLSPNIDF